METRTVEQVGNWNTRPFTDGYAGLRQLSDGEFSGAVEAGGAWLFMLNGRIIGVFEGSLDDFEHADGTAYAAPHPSLPLLFSMQERDGETQAKYYTNDTPLSEVDSTLSSGKFTGFIELSENVLSGDYYVAYYGGRSMSVAFVGASEQVVTGDDAFERANDEVGIYEVRDVDVEVTDVPEPEGGDESASEPETDAGNPTESAAAGASAGGGSEDVGTATGAASPTASATDAMDAADHAESDDASAGSATPTDRSEPDHAAPNRPASDRSTPDVADATGVTEATDATGATDADDEQADEPDAPETGADPDATTVTQASVTADADPTAGAKQTADAERASDVESTAGASSGPAVEPSPSTPADPPSSADAGIEEAEPETAPATRTSDDAGDTDDSADADSDDFSAEAEWRETTTIPSLDPDRSEGPDDETEAAVSATTERTTGAPAERAETESKSRSRDRSQSRSSGRARPDPQSSEGPQPPTRTSESTDTSRETATESASAGGSEGAADAEEARTQIRKLRSQLRKRKRQVEQLRERVSTIESERDEFERERDALRQEVERLEAELERARSDEAGGSGRRLNETQAFDGTNLFVRYQSKGKATLDEAAEGKVEADDVNANLRLEHHTQFEADAVSVDGESFESFLTDSFEYRFVSWIVEDLLYEIRDTGHRTALKELYEAIPKIDRVDLHGTVSAGGDDEDTRQESFDVILRDRMGNPLLVADLNGSRDPTTGDMMGSLVDAASGVGEAYDELAGAFQVTESFFEPEALETTEAATSGGFLSREKRESFVKLSRKRGYHLCLVESRSGGFHLNVPEL